MHGDGVRCANYSPDNNRIVTSSLDGTAVIWNARIPASLDVQFAWLKAAQFDPLTESELSQLGLTIERDQSADRKSQVNKRSGKDPIALAQSAARNETVAIDEKLDGKRTELLLAAFRDYTLAVEYAPTAPEATVWRYHRATLARRLAQLGKMAEVANASAEERK